MVDFLAYSDIVFLNKKQSGGDMATRKATSTKTKAAPASAKAYPAPVLDEAEADIGNVRDSDTLGGESETLQPILKKRELYELVSTRSGLAKNKIRPVVDAMIDVLGETIAQGRGMNLPPMGRVMIKRSKDGPNARISIVKVRQPTSQMSKTSEPVDPLDD